MANNVFTPRSDTLMGKGLMSDSVKKMKGAQDEAMEFQMWVSKQAHELSRLKVFHSMAKSVNDQQ